MYYVCFWSGLFPVVLSTKQTHLHMKETAYTGTRVLTREKSITKQQTRLQNVTDSLSFSQKQMDMYTHLLLSETPFSMRSKSALTTVHAVCCSNRGIPSASHRHYTALKAWRTTMPQVQVGVALTYLSNTTIVRSCAFVLYPHHTIFLEVSFSLWMLSMHHRSSTSNKHFITT